MAGKRVWWGLAATVAFAAAALAVGSAQAETVHVELKDFAFDPQNVTVHVGDTVMWTNNDTMNHDVTFEAGFDSGGQGSLAPGETFNHTFDTAGDFNYRCTLHSSDFATGMVGKVTVESMVPASDWYVELKNAQFTPAELHIQPGDTVTWINNETFGHDVHFEAGFGSGAAGGLMPGETYTHTFDEDGTFRYRCDIHSANFDAGMVGTVIVGDGGQSTPPPSGGLPGFEGAFVLVALVGAALAIARVRRR